MHPKVRFNGRLEGMHSQSSDSAPERPKHVYVHGAHDESVMEHSLDAVGSEGEGP